MNIKKEGDYIKIVPFHLLLKMIVIFVDCDNIRMVVIYVKVLTIIILNKISSAF